MLRAGETAGKGDFAQTHIRLRRQPARPIQPDVAIVTRRRCADMAFEQAMQRSAARRLDVEDSRADRKRFHVLDTVEALVRLLRVTHDENRVPLLSEWTQAAAMLLMTSMLFVYLVVGFNL